MSPKHNPLPSLLIILTLLLSACANKTATPSANAPLKILVVETFLADITQNIAGDRLTVDTLLPLGLDPHAFEPTPQDVTRIAEAQVLIINGAGFETWLTKTLENAGGQHTLIEAAARLQSRKPSAAEVLDPGHTIDPHFWLDPNNVIQYTQNIRDGLIAVDPAGKTGYTQNAANYISQLKDLDGWIKTKVEQIPPQNRLLVTNHESFGYFADRYGFTIIGTVIPSASTEASPSAKQMVDLIERIKQSAAKAIFLETGANPQIAEQIAQETGVQVITGMLTHSITEPGGEAPTYIEMMKHNVNLLDVLK